MCILVTSEEKLKKEKELIEELLKKYKNIKTIIKNINTKNTNVILGEKNINLYGDGYIQDKLGEYTFKISANSFYQVNPTQTEKLYALAVKEAKIKETDTILDLYCGIGTIGIFASKQAKKVYGIEIVKQAIENAKENSKINKIKNTEFISGDVEQILDKLIQKEKITPNIIFVDPPRKGLDNNTINNLIKITPEKIIYISCNPATLARDLSKLEEKYKIEKITPVDMFPWTSHVECCSVLYLKDTIQ